jgi:hypothetical protein
LLISLICAGAILPVSSLADSLPNLTPYQPSGWSDKIVVSKTVGSTTDSSPLYPTDTLYVDWAVINNGSAATAARFYTSLYVDGVYVTQWYTDPPLNPNYYTYVQDYSIGTLGAGTHTIRIVANSTGVIAESNETDNDYTKTITVTAVPTLPNLTPYQPSGWSDKIVVSRALGSTTDSSPLYPTDTLYVEWAVINNGSAATAARFYTSLYVDGVYFAQWYTDPPLNPNYYIYVQDYSIATLGVGTHTIRIVADSTSVIAESNETDNDYTKTITVIPLPTAPVPGNGGMTETSLGQGSLVTAYGQISTTTPTQPAALANFGYTQNGILTTEAGVAASAPTTAARVFVDYGTAKGTDSGVAVVNPSSNSITLNVQLNTAQGIPTTCPNQTVAANGHIAMFASQLCPGIPNPFLGTLTLTSSTPFVATNLMSATNAHAEPLYNSLPVATPNAPPTGSRLYFSQFADGGGFSTEILLMNLTATPISGTVSFLDDNGYAVTLNFGPSIGSTSTLSYSIPGNGMQKFTTTGSTPGTPLQAGAVVVTSTAGSLPSAAVVFSSYNGTGGLASQAGVLNSPLTTNSRMYVEKSFSSLTRDSGVAIENPNSSAATVQLILVSLDGLFSAANTIIIPPNGHMSAFIDQSALMGSAASSIPSNFQGVLTLSSNVPIAPVTLRSTTNQRGENLYSTLPVVDLNNPPTGPLYLPQIADGGGFTTQIILINTSSSPGSITMNFHNDYGAGLQIPMETGPSITSLSTNSAAPVSILAIAGSGFDPTATLSVSFFDNKGFRLDIPVLVAGPTSVEVAVPPYINPATGTFGPGTVNVQLIQNLGGSIVTSNSIQNFQLQDLPTSVAPPGAVTLNLLNGIINYYVTLQAAIRGTLLDVPELNAAIANNLANLQSLGTQVQAVMQSPSTSFTLGSINGNNLVIGTQALSATDKLIIGMFQSLSSTSVPTSAVMGVMKNSLVGATIPCQQEANAYTNFLLNPGLQVTDTSGYNGYAGCSSGGLPVAVQTTNEVVGGAGTLSMGILGFFGAPEIALALPAAAMFNVTAMSVVLQIDVAAALKNVNNSASYQAMHQAVDKIEETLRDLLVGQVIPKTAGNVKDIYSGEADLDHAFGDTATLAPPPPASCTYTYSDWSACQPNGTQTRTVISSSPAGCVGTPVLSQSCTYGGPPPCTYIYSDWSACQPNGTQTRTVISSSPAGCTGTPVLSQPCTPTCCICAFDVYCTVFGPGGCWRCHNTALVGGVCPVPYGSLGSPGICACDPTLYQVCQ